MITSILGSVRRNFILVTLGALVSGTLGCGGTSEMMTYSREARQKGLKQYAVRDYENAAGSFRSATRQDPRDYKSFYYLGACYDAIGSYQQAAQAYQASLKVMDVTLEGRSDKPFRAKTIDGLAIAVAKGHDRTAEIALPHPAKRPAEDAWLRAKVNRYTGDADAALEAYTQAALQDPADFYIAKDYGLYLEELGQSRPADAQLRRAYRMDPSDKDIAAALARIGTVPGPALKERQELAKPAIPQGPLPELKVPTFGRGAQPAPKDSAPEPTVQAPRD